jgi:hypothetical protein
MDPNADAKNRAWRTLLQGLLIDVAAALVLVLTPAEGRAAARVDPYVCAAVHTSARTQADRQRRALPPRQRSQL